MTTPAQGQNQTAANGEKLSLNGMQCEFMKALVIYGN